MAVVHGASFPLFKTVHVSFDKSRKSAQVAFEIRGSRTRSYSYAVDNALSNWTYDLFFGFFPCVVRGRLLDRGQLRFARTGPCHLPVQHGRVLCYCYVSFAGYTYARSQPTRQQSVRVLYTKGDPCEANNVLVSPPILFPPASATGTDTGSG